MSLKMGVCGAESFRERERERETLQYIIDEETDDTYSFLTLVLT